jgi:hypothetical protein
LACDKFHFSGGFARDALRRDLALGLLHRSKQLLKEIAEAVGFQSEKMPLRAFKTWTGDECCFQGRCLSCEFGALQQNRPGNSAMLLNTTLAPASSRA